MGRNGNDPSSHGKNSHGFFLLLQTCSGPKYWYQYDKHCREVVLIDLCFSVAQLSLGCFYFYEGRSINYAVPFCNLFMERLCTLLFRYTCLEMGIALWESHGNGNKTQTWEGMGTVCERERMGIKKLFLAMSSPVYPPQAGKPPSCVLQTSRSTQPGHFCVDSQQAVVGIGISMGTGWVGL